MQTANVSIFSVCSCLGRLVTGVCSDWLLHAHAVPRVGFFLFGSVVVREMDRAPFFGIVFRSTTSKRSIALPRQARDDHEGDCFQRGGFSQMMLSMLMLALGVWQTPPTFWIDCFRFVFDCVCIQRSERRKIKQIIGCHNLSYLPRQAQDANIYIYIHYEKVHRGESCGPCVAQPRPRRFKQRR